MKVIRRILYLFAALILVFLTYWYGYKQKPVTSEEEKRIVPVEVEIVSTGPIEETIQLTGWIKAKQVVDIASKVPGRVESLRVLSDGGDLFMVEEGVAIEKGRQLAVIDHDIYLAQLAAAESSVKARQVELTDTEREKKRVTALYESGSATEQSRDKAVTAAELAAASLELAQANLELAKLNLRESTIVSPINGIVTAKHIDEGNMVNAGDRIVTVADMGTVKVIVAVAERYGAEISAGMPAIIRVDTFTDRQFDARVHSIHPALDAQTHTLQVEIHLKNEKLLLKPGMFARVTLVTNQKDDAVVIPRDVVLGGKIDKHYVYVIEEASDEKIARKRFVEVGIKQADRYEITEGLKAGETLVVNGMNFLIDGTGVDIVRLEDIK
ncbi:MAG: efflux RND transporter periplasmic adaptor subunit [Sedimentisphaerales bacterium]|nr:efflux RND transporter periplasmic adaptor subunit [Sedimentisphaerales bacterium]